MSKALVAFVRQSNAIEGILREPTAQEIQAHQDLLAQDTLTVAALKYLVERVAPGARLRNVPGLNVRVGSHVAPAGGPEIEEALRDLLDRINAKAVTAWQSHIEYETLHPFTDGNGRSGRALWLFMCGGQPEHLPPLLFLHAFYYETLRNVRAA